MRALLLLAIAFLPRAALAQALPPNLCVRYVYADINAIANEKVPVYACCRIVNKRATECHRMGMIDAKKLDAAKDRALSSIIAYGEGMALAFGCYIGLISAPLAARQAGPALTGALMIDQQTASQRMFDKAYENNRRGLRVRGTPPDSSRGEVVKSMAIQGCEYLRKTIGPSVRSSDADAMHAHNAGVNAVLDHFQSNAAFVAVLQADAKFIEDNYRQGTVERREAERQFRARIRIEDAKQRKLLADVKAYTRTVVNYLRDTSATQIPFGTSPENVSEDLNNIPCANPAILKSMRDKMCELAKATAKVQGYSIGDLFRQGQDGRSQQARINDADAATRELVEANCKDDVAGGPTLIERMDEAPHP